MYIHTHINNNVFKTKVLTGDKEKEKGMMGKTFNNEFSAALFVMNHNRANKQHTFWMAGCIIPLDIIFVENGRISRIHHSCPPCASAECKTYSGTGGLIIEMLGGTCKKMNIKRNALVKFYRV